MAETLDVIVSGGTGRWTIPELRKTIDFTAKPEFTMTGVSEARVAEWRDLGWEVKVTRGVDPLARAVKEAKAAKAAAEPKNATAKGRGSRGEENE